ncbi:MAG: DCC1-like thiol-disulfide oxidoreductase family protein [Arenimonas sp.]
MSVAYPLRIYVDDACPLCHAEMAGLAARDCNQRLQMRDCSAAGFRDEDSEAAGFDRAQLLHRIHARDARGNWLVGVPVFAAAYEAAGLGAIAWLLRLRLLQPFWRVGYAWFVDHRRLLLRLRLQRVLAWALRPR